MEHDRRYKYLFAHPGFVQRLLMSFVDEPFVHDIDFSRLKREHVTFVSEEFEGRESDIIWKLPVRDSAIYLFLLLEFQSSVDPRMPIRFTRYIASFYEAYLDENPGVNRLPAVFPVLLYNGEDRWTVPSSIEAMIEQTLPEQFVPRLSYYPIIINTIPKERLARIHNAVSAVFYVENSDPEELAGQLDQLESILKEEEDSAFEVFQRVGRWIRNYLETGGRGDPATLEAFSSMREVKAMFGASLQRYGERKAEEAREEGRQQGRTEGQEQNREEVARRMIERGYSTEDIAELTGLDREKIERLRE